MTSTTVHKGPPGRTLARSLAAATSALLIAGLLSVGAPATPAAAATEMFADFPGALAPTIIAANGITEPVTITIRDRDNSGVWSLPGNLPEIRNHVSIVGPGSGKLTIDMAGKNGFFARGAGGTIDFAISGLSLTNPNSYAVAALDTNLTVADLIVRNAPTFGIAVESTGYKTVNISDSHFLDSRYGILVDLGNAGPRKPKALLDNVTVQGNVSGLRLSAAGNSEITLANSDVYQNTYSGIEASVKDAGVIIVNDSIIEDNKGGGLEIWGDETAGAYSGFVEIRRSAVVDNGATTTASGGIRVAGKPEGLHVMVDRTSVYGNKADNGGGIFMKPGLNSSLDLRHSTVSGNKAQGLASGLYAEGTPSKKVGVFISHSTIAHNGTTNQPGAWLQHSSGSIDHTILSDNGNSANGDLFANGSDLQVRHSLVQLSSGTAKGLVDASTTNISGRSAALGPLQQNGGAIYLKTHLPTVSSPALEAGDKAIKAENTVDFDQRGTGFPRVVGVIDIGAVEAAARNVASKDVTISGTAQVGQTLTANTAAWTPAPVTLAYQWLRDGAVISGATGKTYTLVTADSGKKLSVKVTGTKQHYTTATKTSAAVTVKAAPVNPKDPVKVNRIGGDDRYETAINISKAGFPAAKPNVPVVFVATGADYPDALSAAAAAVKLGGPLLLTPSKSLPKAVEAEIKRLNPAQIVVVGGTGAVSNTVFNSLKKLKNTVRVGGTDRFDTSRKVTAFAFKTADTAYIATGMNYPDALSASAAGAAAGGPVILVNGAAKALDAPTKATLKTLKLKRTFTAGGSAVVSNGIHNGLKAYGTTKRFAGDDRFDTSRLIGVDAFPSAKQVFLATGMQFPDALAGAALAGAKGGPLFTSMPTCIPKQTAAVVKGKSVTQVTLFGGTGALSNNVFNLNACTK